MNRLQRLVFEKRAFLVVFGFLFTFIVLFELPRIIVVIGPGEVGIKYSLFFGGTVIDHIYPEGIKFIFPWDRMYVYNTRIQESKLILSVLTQDGLDVEIDLSVRYHPEVATIGILHQTVGPDYSTKVAIPEVESAIRTSAGKHTLLELYSGLAVDQGPAAPSPAPPAVPAPNIAVAENPTRPMTTAITNDALDTAIAAAIDRASKKYVLIDNVVITRLKIPDYLQAAMQRKLEQAEEVKAEQFRLQKAMIQAEINRQQQLNLTDQVLKLRGIEATERLATSPNAKVVIIGNTANGGLPVIVNTEK